MGEIVNDYRDESTLAKPVLDSLIFARQNFCSALFNHLKKGGSVIFLLCTLFS